MKKLQFNTTKNKKEQNLCINMSVEDLKRVYSACGTFTGSTAKLQTKYIHVSIISGIATFTATNGAVATTITMQVSCNKDGSLLLPVIKIPIDSGYYVTIETIGTEVTFSFSNVVELLVEDVPYLPEDYPLETIDTYMNMEPKMQVAVDSKLFKKLLRDTSDKSDKLIIFKFAGKYKPVRIDYVGKDLKVDKNRKTLLMPMKYEER